MFKMFKTSYNSYKYMIMNVSWDKATNNVFLNVRKILFMIKILNNVDK